MCMCACKKEIKRVSEREKEYNIDVNFCIHQLLFPSAFNKTTAPFKQNKYCKTRSLPELLFY